MSLPAPPDPDRRRQLGHDVKTYLGIVTMGLELLPALRDDPAQFDAMLAEIRSEGIAPLRKVVAELAGGSAA
ncbi:hypothetical protein [Alienimonas chondri]|uniref:Uncharacterized protein n=1 Tax=Alienimonas chondri TaxID=2681879 RepID=A0ABX1VFK1_9PLAN|nr:hypothetical protein [Alienimonas chondri]NNJ26509.1 hypothetical protein [Alienimonas chondri]